MSAPYRIEVLAKQPRGDFDCGTPPLNAYLARQASQDQKRRISVAYLLIDQATDKVAGYYMISAGSVLLDQLPEATRKRLPRYGQVPVARIGRLAVDRRRQAQGLGGLLLWDAIARACQTELAVFAVIVDAKDEQAAAFYTHHGFRPLTSAPLTLFLPLSEAVRKLAAS